MESSKIQAAGYACEGFSLLDYLRLKKKKTDPKSGSYILVGPYVIGCGRKEIFFLPDCSFTLADKLIYS